MKFFIALTLTILSTSVSARPERGHMFNEVLMKGVKEEVKQDDQAFRKVVPAPARAPASVPTPEQGKRPEKIERQLDQMGKQSW